MIRKGKAAETVGNGRRSFASGTKSANRSRFGVKANTNWSDFGLVLLIVVIGLGMSVVVAYLAVAGQWMIAVILLAALPIFVLLHRYPFVALLLWLLATPFMVEDNILPRIAFWGIHRALPLITVGIIVLSSMLGIHPRKLPKPSWPEAAMLLYVVATLLSIVYLNDDVMTTIYAAYDRIIIPMSLYLLVRLTRPSEKDLKLLIPVLIFILISQSIVGILSWTAPQILYKGWLTRLGQRTTGTFGSYTVFTTTVVFCGLIILQSAWNHKLREKSRTGYILLFILAYFMIFFSFSRGSWLAGIAVIGGLIYLYPKRLLKLGLIVIPIVILLSPIFLTGYLDQATRRLSSDKSEESALSRLPIFLAAYKMFEAKPVTGWGFGNFDRYDRQFQERVGDLINAKKDHASHNVYLTLIAEQGVTGFILFLAPAFLWLIWSIRVFRKLPKSGFWSQKLLIIFWLVLVFHIIVNNFSNMKGVFGLGMWWITLGLIANMVHPYLSPFTEFAGTRSFGKNDQFAEQGSLYPVPGYEHLKENS